MKKLWIGYALALSGLIGTTSMALADGGRCCAIPTSAAFPTVTPPGWYTNTYLYDWQYPWYAYYNSSFGPYANWMAGQGYAGYSNQKKLPEVPLPANVTIFLPADAKLYFSGVIANGTGDGFGPQISSKEIIQALFQSFVLDPLTFYILGANVSYSLSPAMHNAAYQALGLNHNYKTKDITSLADLDALAQDSHFGGASIVQPFKVAIYGQLASKSRHAEAIGAVNTLLPLRAQADGSVFSLQSQASQRNRSGVIAAWYGDNTEWIGIMVCLTRNLSPRNVVKPAKTCGLVIGAGGMARAAVYAMLKLGCRNIFLCNRTISNAESVAAHFNSWATSMNGNKAAEDLVRVLRSTEEPWPPSFAMPTMIVSTVTHRSLNGKPAANFEMPPQWLGSSSGGVVVEMAYKPVNTPLVMQMRRARKTTGVPWVVVDGLEILPEQAIAQFELMTGRKAPRGIMRAEILQACQDSAISEGETGNGGGDSKEKRS